MQSLHAAGFPVANVRWFEPSRDVLGHAHVGDPAEDWSSCVSIRGTRTMSGDAWRSLLEREAGFTMSAEHWDYWEAFNLYKAACANRTCLGLFETGMNRSPDMAIMGTAVHHTFLRRLVDIIR